MYIINIKYNQIRELMRSRIIKKYALIFWIFKLFIFTISKIQQYLQFSFVKHRRVNQSNLLLLHTLRHKVIFSRNAKIIYCLNTFPIKVGIVRCRISIFFLDTLSKQFHNGFSFIMRVWVSVSVYLLILVLS